MSFRLKTILGIAVIELTVMAILIAVNQLNYGGTASTQLYERARSTAELFATMVADAVISTDLATLDAMIQNALANKELVYLRVRNEAGVPLSSGGVQSALQGAFSADADFDAALDDHKIDISTPISIAGQDFGSVEIGISTLPVEAEMARALRWNLIVAASGMTLVAIFGYLLGSILTRQLSSLRRGAEMIARGDLGYQISVHGRDELAHTARCFNRMATTLATDRAELDHKQAELLAKRDRTNRIVDSMKDIAAGAHAVDVPDADRPDEIGDMARATVIFQRVMQEVLEARAEQAQLIHAFDQLEEQVAIFGEDSLCMFANAAFRRFNEEILRSLPDFFTYADYLAEGLRTKAFPGAAGQEDAWLSRRLAEISESECPVEVAYAPDRTLLVTRASIPGVGMVVSASDVTDLKTSQAQLIQASKLATLGEMATGIAHELNQPLGVIRMASNNCQKRIQKGQLDADYLVGKLQRMSEQTERAAKIIDHMRVFGRKADGKDHCFDLIASLESTCNLMAKQMAVSGVTLKTNFHAAELQVTGQQIMFEQVILNLLGNARDAIFGEDGQIAESGVVNLSTQTQEDGMAAIIVEDTGGGIPEAALDRLFDPFFTTKPPGKGTGLGLSISYGIIRDMQGTITARNTPTGARFCIRLPVAKNKTKSVAA